MVLERTTYSIGLYYYYSQILNITRFQQFYTAVLSFLESIGVKPTYVGADGDGYSDEFKKINGPMHNRLLDRSFSGITSLSLVTNPAGSDSPAYDSFMSTSLGYVESSQ